MKVTGWPVGTFVRGHQVMWQGELTAPSQGEAMQFVETLAPQNRAMPTVFFISHPEVAVDPVVPVPQWQPVRAAASRAWWRSPNPNGLAGVETIWASTEVKAREAAALLAEHFDLDRDVTDRSRAGENDRSATGFVPPAEFEELADAFCAAE